MTAVSELLDYLTADERSELDQHIAHLAEPTGTTKGLREFVSSVEPRYRWYRHCQLLAEQLQRVADGEVKRLMVFMPPRHGKSLLVSRRFPAYYLRKFPRRTIGLASYEAGLAQDFSRTARDAFVMDGGQLRGDSKAVDYWHTSENGGMWACGVGGPLTGKGADILIVDDPVKNDEEAASETMQEKAKSWYDATFSTRLDTTSGAVVVVQTRWDMNDLSGYLLEKEKLEAEGWVILNLPAIAEQSSPAFPESCTVLPDWRAEGEALCPERFSEPALAKIKNRVGSYFWSALYQQRPSPAEGGMFKRAWWKYYAQPPKDMDFLCQSWDMAFKDTDDSDYVVGQVWGVKDANFYLLDQVRDRLDFPATVMAVRTMTAKWPTAHGKFVEDKANGPAVISSLRQKIPGLVAVNPQGGKESRAAGVSPLAESGNVYLPEPELAPWVSEFVEECAAFPNGVNDDQVDAMTQALTKIGPVGREKAAAPDPVRKSEDRATPWKYENGRVTHKQPEWDDYSEQQERRTPGYRRPLAGRH